MTFTNRTQISQMLLIFPIICFSQLVWVQAELKW